MTVCAMCAEELGESLAPLCADQYRAKFPDYPPEEMVLVCEYCHYVLMHGVFSTDLVRFVRESNYIEGIRRDPTVRELSAHMQLLALEHVSVADLERFVHAVQPGAKLRVSTGMNVRVGGFTPHPGGPRVGQYLQRLLAATGATPAWRHWWYETLHPFTDGNGRSGRALWLRDMGGTDRVPLGFMHHWYYQSLELLRAPGRELW